MSKYTEALSVWEQIKQETEDESITPSRLGYAGELILELLNISNIPENVIPIPSSDGKLSSSGLIITPVSGGKSIGLAGQTLKNIVLKPDSTEILGGSGHSIAALVDKIRILSGDASLNLETNYFKVQTDGNANALELSTYGVSLVDSVGDNSLNFYDWNKSLVFGGYTALQSDTTSLKLYDNVGNIAVSASASLLSIGFQKNTVHLGNESSLVIIGTGSTTYLGYTSPGLFIGEGTNTLELGKSSTHCKLGEYATNVYIASDASNAEFAKNADLVSFGIGANSINIGGLATTVEIGSEVEYLYVGLDATEMYMGGAIQASVSNGSYVYVQDSATDQLVRMTKANFNTWLNS